MNKEQLKDLLDKLKKGLSELYGTRLKGFYIFGSYARGTQEPESDLDVLILLNDIDDYNAEIDCTGKLVSDLSLQYDLLISTVFVTWKDWQHGQNPFLRSVRRDVVAA
ncbi:MAG: hypothetical protein A2Z83_00420 [Omnitrophica bacterium GWA2_52_8]|nr:MAG: hypothetical protein A2Z83_00420 [Omnitrophica bacterium GWA2_52_8]